MKKLFYILGIVLAPAVGLLFVDSASAVASDVTYTLDANSTFPFTVCSNPTLVDVPKCSDYSHVIFEPSGAASNYRYSVSFYYASMSFPNFDTTIVGLSSLDSTASVSVSSQSSVFTGDFQLKITLTNSLEPEPCPEPEPCDCPIDCSEPAIVQLFKSGFWGVATALTTIIVPVLALFLIFRIVHDLLWGKG